MAIRAHDWDKSVKFYTEALGFKEKIRWGEGERGIMLDTGDGNYLEIFANGSAEPKPEGCIIHFALRTDNCDAAVERARGVGVVITIEPKDIVIQASRNRLPCGWPSVRGRTEKPSSSFKTQRPERRRRRASAPVSVVLNFIHSTPSADKRMLPRIGCIYAIPSLPCAMTRGPQRWFAKLEYIELGAWEAAFFQ